MFGPLQYMPRGWRVQRGPPPVPPASPVRTQIPSHPALKEVPRYQVPHLAGFRPEGRDPVVLQYPPCHGIRLGSPAGSEHPIVIVRVRLDLGVLAPEVCRSDVAARQRPAGIGPGDGAMHPPERPDLRGRRRTVQDHDEIDVAEALVEATQGNRAHKVEPVQHLAQLPA